MTPLVQQLQEQKDLIDRHVQDLNGLQQNGATAAGRLKALNTLVLELDQELNQARVLAGQLNRPAPHAAPANNIIDLARARR